MKKILLVMHEDRWSKEYLCVDTETNTPYHIWEDAGNLHGNHSIQLTWEKVEQLLNP